MRMLVFYCDCLEFTFSLAEGEGFEPSLQVAPDYLVSNETPSTTWVTLRMYIFYHIICAKCRKS